MAGNINLVNVQVLTNLVIAAELSGQRLVPLTAQQLTQAVNLVAVILAQAVILKQTPEVVIIQVEQSAEQCVINQNHVAIQVPPTGAPFIVLVMEIAVKMERFNLVIQNAAARDVLLPVAAVRPVVPEAALLVEADLQAEVHVLCRLRLHLLVRLLVIVVLLMGDMVLQKCLSNIIVIVMGVEGEVGIILIPIRQVMTIIRLV